MTKYEIICLLTVFYVYLKKKKKLPEGAITISLTLGDLLSTSGDL